MRLPGGGYQPDPPKKVVKEGDAIHPPKLSPNRFIKEAGTHKGFFSKIPKKSDERSWGLVCFVLGFHIGVIFTAAGLAVSMMISL